MSAAINRTCVFLARRISSGLAMAHSVNPNLDQRMSHMHFYDKKVFG
jgi:hypothetical protein